MEDIEKRLEKEWIVGRPPNLFQKQVAAAREALHSDASIGPVLIAEREPKRFLTIFISALLENRDLILASPDWSEKERETALRLTTPSRCFPPEWAGRYESQPGKTFRIQPGVTEILIPTGGSGGRMRFARHRWETLMAAAGGVCAFFNGEPINQIRALPLHHVSGLQQAMRTLAGGGLLRLTTARNLEETVLEIERPERWLLSLVPTQLFRLLKSPDITKKLRLMRGIILGGAGAAPPLLREAARNDLPIILSYGSTETAAMVTAQSVDDFRAGLRGSGRPLPHARVRIIPTPGVVIEAEKQIGEIDIQSMSLFSGYIGDSGGPAPDGWWRAGDTGWIDAGGRLHILGRSDEVINTGGEKVWPAEVEAAIQETELVVETAVIGTDDPEWGEIITAVFTPVRREKDPASIRNALADKLAPHKIPKRWIAVDELPKNPLGKIDRARLRAMAAEMK